MGVFFDNGRVNSQLTSKATLVIRLPHTGNFPFYAGILI